MRQGAWGEELWFGRLSKELFELEAFEYDGEETCFGSNTVPVHHWDVGVSVGALDKDPGFIGVVATRSV